jgi:hypothetical protein
MQSAIKAGDIQGIETVEEVNENSGVKRNNLIFAILTILFQIAAGLIYGFLIRPQPVSANGLYPIFLTVCYAFLVVAGTPFYLFRLWALNFLSQANCMVRPWVYTLDHSVYS